MARLAVSLTADLMVFIGLCPDDRAMGLCPDCLLSGDSLARAISVILFDQAPYFALTLKQIGKGREAMRKVIIGAFALGTAFVYNPANAESFQGPYVGAQAGWNQDSIGATGSDVGRLDIHESRASFVGGVYAGYDYQVTPHIVLGVEAGFDLAADDASRVGGALIDPNYSFDVGARAGYMVGEKTLVYVRGSYENMRAQVQNGSVSGHDTFDGWGVGGGVERFVADNVSARVEYRYSDLSNGGKFDRHQALVGVAYHF